MASGIELQSPTATLTRPSWIAVPDDFEDFPLQKRTKVVMGLCAGIACIGSLSIAALNVLALREPLADTFLPAFPVLTPLLFCLLSAGTSVNLWITVKGLATAPDRRARHSSAWLAWYQPYRTTGRLFHSKVLLLEVLRLLNQGRNLMRLLFLGQAANWIYASSSLICVNAMVTPLLHFSQRVQNNTFYLMIFDALMDTAFGAVLPVCMVLEVAAECLSNNPVLTFGDLSKSQLVQAFLIGRGLVPVSAGQLLSLAWPYLSLWIKLGDLRDAREYWSHRGTLDHRRRLCGPVFGALFLLTGLVLGLLGATARLRSPCWTVAWRDGCQAFRFDLWGRSCECIAYEKLEKCEWQLLEDMLLASRSLQIVILSRCWKYRILPSLENNVDLLYLVVLHSDLEELPPLRKLVALRELRVRFARLHELPQLSSNNALRVLDVEQNRLHQLPSLDGNKFLQQLSVVDNQISELPSLDKNRALVQLLAAGNHLTSLPDLNDHPKLERIYAAMNNLTVLPPLNSVPELRSLLLSGNRLEELPSLAANTKLYFLDVAENSLKSLRSLQTVPKLRVLQAASNFLQEMPSISPRAKLRVLNVSFNKLKPLDLTSAPFQSLRYLYAEGNNLEELPGLEGMTNLTAIQLAHNRLQKLPPLDGPDLVWLDVKANRLVELSISTYPFLRKLDASDNHLTSIHGLEMATRLDRLFLQNNSLVQLPGLQSCHSLIVLDVSRNFLSSLPQLPPLLWELRAAWNLLRRVPDIPGSGMKRLDMGHNVIEYIPAAQISLEHYGKIYFFNLRGNKLTQLPSLDAMASELRTLDVSENLLTSLPSLSKLTWLLDVYVAQNQLNELPDLSKSQRLHTLSCKGNPLKKLPRLTQRNLSCDCCAP